MVVPRCDSIPVLDMAKKIECDNKDDPVGMVNTNTIYTVASTIWNYRTDRGRNTMEIEWLILNMSKCMIMDGIQESINRPLISV